MSRMRWWKQRRHAEESPDPVSALAFPERVTSREYYGALLGMRFETDAASAEHYLSDGWREGVLPHPFLDRPMARSSMDEAVRLRNELREFGTVAEARPRLGALVGIADLSEMREAGKTSLIGSTADFLAASAAERDALLVRGGMTWGELRALLADSSHVVPRIEAAGFFDLEHYGRARPFLSWRAALDDYLVSGENDGLTPNWAFEPEWHAAHDRSQQRGPRAFNQLFQYVLGGEHSTTSPAHSDGRSLGDLLEAEDDESVFPEGEEQISLGSMREAASTDASFEAEPRQGRRVAFRGGAPLDVAVIVDGRHLVSPAHVEELRELTEVQDAGTAAVFVVTDADDGHEPPLSVQLDGQRVSFRSSGLGTPFGATAAALVEENGFPAWTLWRPGQRWKPNGLIDMTRALEANPQASAAAAYTPHAPQQWGSLSSALWHSRLDAAGIVFRTDRIAPDARWDYGLNADAVARLAIAGDGMVIEGDRFWARAYDANVHANRAGANLARKNHMPEIECTLPDGLRATVVIPTYQDWRMTLEAVRAVLASQDVGVIVVDNGSRRAVGAILGQAFAADSRVQLVRLPRNTDFAVASDLGARVAKSDAVVFLNNDTLVQEAWLDVLLSVLPSAAAAQPMLLFADRTVQSAGTVFAGGLSMPRHLFSGFHLDDVPVELGDYNFSALTAACLAVRRFDYLEAGGFDAEYVNGMEDIDLCLRLKQQTGSPLRLAMGARVVHLESKTEGRFAHVTPNRHRFAQRWRHELLTELDDRHVLDGTGLRVADVRWLPKQTADLREPEWRIERAAVRVVEHPPRLRWAIKFSSPGTIGGDLWGDSFFAADLAAALRRLGQQVLLDRTSSWERPESSGWDDITLTLRGLQRYTPQPGATNLLWVISHPDRVTIDELSAGWDRVYSAGRVWAKEQAALSRVEVLPLLQATDSTRFRNEGNARVRRGVLFVGRTRGERRPIVLDASEVTSELSVYGDDGWERYLDSRHIRGASIPNTLLPQAYSGARVVLNDHWDDMRRGGFLSNRLFDAAATGARIVSDDVAGLHEIFGDQVRTYSSADELKALLAADSTQWPGDDEMATMASRVASVHSFDARARTLLDDVLRTRRVG